MEMLRRAVEMLCRVGQKLGPYLVLEILLPGGTMVALALLLFRNRALRTGRSAPWAFTALRRA
jgi:hypothetical protein